MKDKVNKFRDFLSKKGINCSFLVEDVFQNKEVVTFINPLTLKNLDDEYLEDLYCFDKVYSDGGLLSSYYSREYNRVGRYSFDGNSIAEDVFNYIGKKGLRFALVGSKEYQVIAAAEVLEKEFGIKPVYTRDGYNIDIKDLVNELAQAKVDVVILGLGQRLQERVLISIKKELPDIVGFTCGGFIHQMSTNKRFKYYPEWINEYGLRSIYRVYREGFSIFFRYIFDYSEFYKLLLKRNK
jgi:exopolysaccharide biosynthesis WecB/TagA/CpsF family protein